MSDKNIRFQCKLNNKHEKILNIYDVAVSIYKTLQDERQNVLIISKNYEKKDLIEKLRDKYVHEYVDSRFFTGEW